MSPAPGYVTLSYSVLCFFRSSEKLSRLGRDRNLLDHSRLAILPSLLVTTRVFFSSEALQLFFLRLLPICYSPETAFLNLLGFWTRALIDELECPILSAGGFENFFDPLWDEVIEA